MIILCSLTYYIWMNKKQKTANVILKLMREKNSMYAIHLCKYIFLHAPEQIYNDVCYIRLLMIFLAGGVKTTIQLHIRTGRNSFSLRKRSDDSNVVIQSVVSSLKTQCSVLVSSCSSKCNFCNKEENESNNLK